MVNIQIWSEMYNEKDKQHFKDQYKLAKLIQEIQITKDKFGSDKSISDYKEFM